MPDEVGKGEDAPDLHLAFVLEIDHFPGLVDKTAVQFLQGCRGTNRVASGCVALHCRLPVELSKLEESVHVEGQALLEPIPLRKTPTPPVIPERIDLSRDDATVYLTDIYDGPGLDGVPRGAVKSLRLFTYHFAYQKIAGINHRVGADGP